jgi:agmatinase
MRRSRSSVSRTTEAQQPGIPTGQRAGPAAARAATEAQFYYPRLPDGGDDPGAEGWYDVEAARDYLVGVRMADVGDVAIQGSDTEANYGRITSAVRAIVEQGALPIALGGDHSISYPLGRGMQPLGEFDVVHIDAHTDFLDDLDGARLTGASQLRRLAELPFAGTVTALGVRNVDRVEVHGLRDLGGRWATTRDVLDRGAARSCARPSRSQTRSTSRSISMCSTPRSRPGTRSRSPAAQLSAAARDLG